jgi:segregation and condensation protein A
MDYKITIDNFDGPLDLLLHLIKQSNIDIFDIRIEQITKQYLDYIKAMENLNLNVASEYLIMAAELIEMKSSILLPNNDAAGDEFEEDPRERLINRLLEYKRYKEVTSVFKNLEEVRKTIYTKDPSNLGLYQDSDVKVVSDLTSQDLFMAFQKFLERKELEKPLNTKITKKEYSVKERSNEIMSILKRKKEVSFEELFEVITKEYVVITFLSILELAKNQVVEIKQTNNFEEIYLVHKGSGS